MGAEYLSFAPTFYVYIFSVLASVQCHHPLSTQLSSVEGPDICLIISGCLCSLSLKSHFNVKFIFFEKAIVIINKSSAQAKKLNAESPALTLKWILDTLL